MLLNNMNRNHFNQIKKERKFLGPKGFVLALYKAKVPISSINTNAWEHNPSPAVYIDLPYGSKNGRQQKRYIRFSKIDLKRAIKFYRTNK